MRSISLHPASLALGLVLGVVCLLSMGQATITPSALGTTVRVEYLPHPRDYVQIKESTPFTVPSGMLLVVSALGSSAASTGTTTELAVDGQVEAAMQVFAQGNMVGDVPSVGALATGLTVHAGSVVTVSDVASGNAARAWGYLANQ